jgi:hypothetical protein
LGRKQAGIFDTKALVSAFLIESSSRLTKRMMACPKSFFMKKPKPCFAAILLILSFAFAGCRADKTEFVSPTGEVLVRNAWTVDYYYNTQDMTDEFSSSRLLFSSTGAVGYQKNGETIAGKWSIKIDAANNELIDLQFNTSSANVNMLNESWKLVSRSANSLQFEGNSAADVLFTLKTQ